MNFTVPSQFWALLTQIRHDPLFRTNIDIAHPFFYTQYMNTHL